MAFIIYCARPQSQRRVRTRYAADLEPVLLTYSSPRPPSGPVAAVTGQPVTFVTEI